MKRYIPLLIAVLSSTILFQQGILAMPEVLMLVLLGALAGIFAGLFGIGGGTVIVPGLVYVFTKMNVPTDLRMHMALGTSLAVIIPASIAAMRAQMAKGAVSMDYVKRLAPSLMVGAFIGAYAAHFIPSQQLMIIFSVFLLFISLNIVLSSRKKPVTDKVAVVPGLAVGAAVGVIVGMVSALLGIGGGALLVPVLLAFGLAMHVAVGTSSAMGSIIALPGAIGYIVSGWSEVGRPELSLGYISIAALLILAPLATYTAPYGVRLSHHLPVKVLKLGFAAFLAAVAIRMFMKAMT